MANISIYKCCKKPSWLGLSFQIYQNIYFWKKQNNNKKTERSWVSRRSSSIFSLMPETWAQLQIKPAEINDVLSIKYLVLLYQLRKTAASGDCWCYLEVVSLLSQRENFIPLEIQSWGRAGGLTVREWVGLGNSWEKEFWKQACCFSYPWCVCLLCV